jgi:UDP-GlcNAc:undecaprenyl-phosphate GlcNAc-1-phosphate transferase
VPKTFLGDAGSKLLGFIVVCLLLAAASGQVGEVKLIQPATALFVVALPLFDMVFTSLRRIIKKGSPFAADRSHIHHLMQDLGFSDRRALVIILCIHSSVALIGLVLHRAGTPEYYQLAIFMGCFALYSVLSSQLWLVAARLQSQGVAINVKFEDNPDAIALEANIPSDNVSPLRPPTDGAV